MKGLAMDLSLTPGDLAFRDEIRAFLAAELKPEWRGVSNLPSRPDLDVTIAWTRLLAAKGWLTTGWPAEYGGKRLSAMQKYIFAEETARVRAPIVPHMHFGMVAPLITMFGDQRQKDRFLPRILSFDDIWAQGFSEPGSGSDLASLRTTARLEDGAYIVEGQKIWTTNAHIATELLCLVRTDPAARKPQLGISILLIPMDLPGITVRPIRTIDGMHHFNEVFLDNVRVPADRLLGAENRGWDYAKALLAHERNGIAEVQQSRVLLDEAADAANSMDVFADAAFADRFARLAIDLDALEILELRFIDRNERDLETGYEASILKIVGSEIRQRVLVLGLEALGALAEIKPGKNAPGTPTGAGRHFASDALFYRAASIYGGSNEIQRNIIAKMLLASNEEI